MHDDLEGGSWRLRFGDEDAEYGGEVLLGNPPALIALQPAAGDLARLDGSIDPNRMTIWMSGTFYAVERAEIISRASAGTHEGGRTA